MKVTFIRLIDRTDHPYRSPTAAVGLHVDPGDIFSKSMGVNKGPKVVPFISQTARCIHGFTDCSDPKFTVQ
jgi:hypothetical protein